MKKNLVFKSFIMAFLIVMLPVTIPVAIADDGAIPPPGDQCYDKAAKGEEFIDFMDNGVIKSLEIVASVLWGIATVVNTIDWFFTLTGSVLGHQGMGAGSTCCPLVFIPALAAKCGTEWALYAQWQGIKSTGVLPAILSIATCECCKGNSGKENKGEGIGGTVVAIGGGAGGICPLGDLTNGLSEGNVFGVSLAGDPSQKGNGLNQYHLSAFDNIYLAVGCLCPIAILHNLRKLKTIYHVHNCCVEQACKSGTSVEVCERQFDEASCMYWEGSILKTLIKALASIAVGFIAGMFTEELKKLAEHQFMSCVFLVLDLIQIPARVQSLFAAFDWLGKTFNEPTCGELDFDDVKEQLESGYDSQSAGISYTMQDTNTDGRYDSLTNGYNSYDSASYCSDCDTGCMGNSDCTSSCYTSCQSGSSGNTNTESNEEGEGVLSNIMAVSSSPIVGIAQSVAAAFSPSGTNNAPRPEMPVFTADDEPITSASGLEGKTLFVPGYDGKIKLTGKNDDGSYTSDKGPVNVYVDEQAGVEVTKVQVGEDWYQKESYESGDVKFDYKEDGKQNRLIYNDDTVMLVKMTEDEKNNLNAIDSMVYSSGGVKFYNEEMTSAILSPLEKSGKGDFSSVSIVANELGRSGANPEDVQYNKETNEIKYGDGLTINLRDKITVTSTTKTSVDGEESIVKDIKTYDGDKVSFNRQIDSKDSGSFTMDKEEYMANIAGREITEVDSKGSISYKEGELIKKVVVTGDKVDYYENKDAKTPYKTVEIMQSSGEARTVKLTIGTSEPVYKLSDSNGKADLSETQWKNYGGTTVTDSDKIDAYNTLGHLYGQEMASKATYTQNNLLGADEKIFVIDGDDKKYTYHKSSSFSTLRESTIKEGAESSYTEFILDEDSMIGCTDFKENGEVIFINYAENRIDLFEYSEDQAEMIKNSLAFPAKPTYTIKGNIAAINLDAPIVVVPESTVLYHSEKIGNQDITLEVTGNGKVSEPYYFDGEGNKVILKQSGDDWIADDGSTKITSEQYTGLVSKSTSSETWKSLQQSKEETDKKKVEIEKVQEDKRLSQTKAEHMKKVQAKQANHEADFRKAYALVWAFMDLALEEYAFGFIDEMCMQDWEASESTPATDTYSGDPGTGGTGGAQGGTSETTGNGAPAACTAPTITAQLREESGKYKISYTVVGCGTITSFKVYLQSSTVPDYVIVSNGYAANGQVVSDDPEITAAIDYTQVCVEASGSVNCFPKAA